MTEQAASAAYVARDVRCPECFQPAGYACITWRGERAHYTHAARKREAATTQSAPERSL